MFKKSVLILINVCYLLVTLTKFGSSESLIVLHINEKRNLVAQNAVQTALEYISKDKGYNLNVDYQYVEANISNENTVLKSVCDSYDSVLNTRKPIHLILDTSTNRIINRLVQQFSLKIGIPVVSTNPPDPRHNFKSNRFVSISLPLITLVRHLKSLTMQQIIYTCVIILEDIFHVIEDLEQFRATFLKFNFNMFPRINDYIDADVKHFIFVGNSTNARWLLQEIVSYYQLKRELKWYFFIMDINTLITDFEYSNVMIFNPIITAPQKSKQSLLMKSVANKNWDFGINDIFYFEVALNAFHAVEFILGTSVIVIHWHRSSKFNVETPISKQITYTKCNEEYKGTTFDIEEPDFDSFFLKHKFNGTLYGQVKTTHSKFFYITLDLNISKLKDNNVTSLGTWKIDEPSLFPPSLPRDILLPPLKIVAILEPLLFEDSSTPTGLNGLYIDLIDIFAKRFNFKYSIAIGDVIGEMDSNKQWNGAIKDLKDRKVDMILGSIEINSWTEDVVDFTVPIGESKGFAMLAKKYKRHTSLFQFLHVFEGNVWVCFIYTYLFTSIVLWILDFWSPYSSRNNKNQISKTEREFTLKECLWFCIISLTPQGGGAIPRNFSGKICIIIWWIFSFILIIAYTVNLASFMTITKMYSHIDTISDLFDQHDISYGPYINSTAYGHFNNMRNIEKQFFEKWKNISLSIDNSAYENSQFAVWTNPVKDSNILFIKEFEHDFPNSFKEAIERVKGTKSRQVGFVYIGDAIEVDFVALTNCDLMVIGKESSKRLHGFALQQDSPLKEIFDKAYVCDRFIELLRNHEYNKLMIKWWDENPKRNKCKEEDDGIGISHLVGLFMLLLFGIIISFITLSAEFYLFKRKVMPK